MILEISPAKIPRVIGRRGSMINMIQDILKIQTMVGQNGRIWIRTSDTDVMRLAIKAFKMIEAQAHTSKLTDRVKAMLEDEMASIRGDEPAEDMPEESMEMEDSEESEDSVEPVEEIKEEDTADGEKPVTTEEPHETDVAAEAIEDSPEDDKEAETESEETENETTEEVSE
jgi:exosome complex component RRP4